MHNVTSRAVRRSLALAALATLTACADDPVAPTTVSPREPARAAQASGWVELTVTTKSGGTEVGSLRWAVDQIGSAGGEITFAPELEGDTIVLGGTLAPEGPLYITGPAKGIVISGDYERRVIRGTEVGSNGTVGLTNVTITRGFDPYNGSAIYAMSLNLQNSTVQDSRGPGSAIRVRYSLHATNSTVARNNVYGPAIEYSQYAQVYLTHTTVASNIPGPGLGVYGPLDYGHSMIVSLNNSIVAHNGAPLRNCATTAGLRYEGWNIVNDRSCGEYGLGIGDPQLSPLSWNGGPTMTYPIAHTSPAFNTGRSCQSWVQTDQRYVPRDAKCDIGAFEFNDFTQVTLTIDPAVKLDATGKALLTGTLRCTRDDAFRLALELHQDQKVGRQTVDVHAASDIPVSCGTAAKPWSAPLGLAAGQAFQGGAARATATTLQTPEWATSASAEGAVKISVTRK